MLYDFHNQQNAKKPGTIHATYLLSGTKRREAPVVTNGGVKQDGEDQYMQSSPFMSSSMPQPEEDTGESSVLTISLVREEDLESNGVFPHSLGPMLTFHQRSTVPVRAH
jgi:DNA polymerase delta subunit 3